MQGKSLREWIEIYEKKTKDTFEVPAGYRLLYLAERGFVQLKPDFEGKIMLVYQLCGDAKFWRDFAELVCSTMGLECVSTICTRHIEPYIRGFGWEILQKEDNNGHYRYWCQDSIGRLVVCTFKNINSDTGEPNYWVTHYLNTKATTPNIEGIKNTFMNDTDKGVENRE